MRVSFVGVIVLYILVYIKENGSFAGVSYYIRVNGQALALEER